MAGSYLFYVGPLYRSHPFQSFKRIQKLIKLLKKERIDYKFEELISLGKVKWIHPDTPYARISWR